MPPPAGKCSSEQVGKSASGSGPREERAKRVPATKPGWALTLEGLAAMSPTQRHRHLLFGDVLKDVGAAASIFPRESVELEYLMPDPRAWTQCELPTERWNRLLGVLKAAEARGRVRALRLRYTRMRAEEIALLIQRQGSARAAIRLETFLPPQLKPTRIPDPLDRQEVLASPGWVGGPLASSHTDPSPSPQRRRVETILEEAVDGSIFPR
ncbi:LOW QUALITY PROTEIN: protein LKAAEAR1 [Callospermophilus lateralis]